VPLADEHVARRLEPVLGERPEQAAHDGAAHADVGVAPVVGVLRVPRPLLGDADAAGHPHPAVGDQQLAVGAVGDPPDRVRLHGPEAADLDARLAHAVEHAGLHLQRPDRVHEHVAGHAGAGALGDRVGHLVGDVAAPVRVGEQAERAFRLADRLEVRGEDRVAVDEQLHVVAPGDGGARQRLGGAQEARVGGVTSPQRS
jgi:hypothetical protein